MESLVYILLALTSVVGLAFIVERGLALRWSKVVPPEIEAVVEKCETAGGRSLAAAGLQRKAVAARAGCSWWPPII